MMTYHFYQKEWNLKKSKGLLKQAINHGLILKKVDRVIRFNQKAWQKPYIDMNNKERQKARNNFEKDFLSWWIIQLLEKLSKMRETIEILNLQ